MNKLFSLGIGAFGVSATKTQPESASMAGVIDAEMIEPDQDSRAALLQQA